MNVLACRDMEMEARNHAEAMEERKRAEAAERAQLWNERELERLRQLRHQCVFVTCMSLYLV